MWDSLDLYLLLLCQLQFVLMMRNCMQFDSTALEGSISDVKVTTLELKAELGKSNQKLLALTQRMETLERRPQRTLTRNQSMAPAHMTPSASMARAPSTAPSPAMGSNSSMMSSSSNAEGLLAAATAEASTTAAEADAAVAPSQAVAGVPLASSSGPGPSVNFAADTVSVRPSPVSTPVADSASVSGMPQAWLCNLLMNCWLTCSVHAFHAHILAIARSFRLLDVLLLSMLALHWRFTICSGMLCVRHHA